MALLGIEGFDAITSNDPNPFDFGNTPGTGNTNPRYAGGVHCTTVNNSEPGWNIPNQQKIIQGGAFGYTNNPSTGAAIFKIYDVATCHASLYFDQVNKVIKVYRGDGATLLGTSANLGGAVGVNIWIYIEWEVVIDNSAGTIKVWVNGAPNGSELLNLSGLDTQNTANAFATKAAFILPPERMDDIYLLDGSGSAPFNARLGDFRVYTLVPTSDDSIQFTPLSGTNFSNVDELGTGGIDEDTTYVESSTVGHIDRFGITDLPVGVVPACAELRYVAKKTDAGVREMRDKLDSGGTNSNGATKTLTTSYVHYRRVLEKDPTDSAAWTKAKVDALKVGFEVVT